MFLDPTGDDPGKMLKIWINIYADSVKAGPFSKPDTDRRDFIFTNAALRRERFLGTFHPDANAPRL